jgi:NADH dehydrogenase [ubiquinone] 1 alpha subcomplex assembly factor 7
VIVVANEFFDALPVRQFVRTRAGWAERCVGLDDAGALVFGLSPAAVPKMEGEQAHIEAIAERAPARTAVARAIGERLAAAGGAALVIDYGFTGTAIGDTLQAVRAHRFVDVLAEPGLADLTSHVDFTRLADAFAEGGARTCPVTSQGAFLNALGAAARVAKLKTSATPAQAEDLDGAYHRLTAPEAMGSLFKVLCAFAPDTLQPAGFSGS